MDHCQRAFSVGREDELSRRVEGDRVDSLADWQGGDDLSVLGIYDDQALVVATGKETMVLGVDGETRRLFARRERPLGELGGL